MGSYVQKLVAAGGRQRLPSLWAAGPLPGRGSTRGPPHGSAKMPRVHFPAAASPQTPKLDCNPEIVESPAKSPEEAVPDEGELQRLHSLTESLLLQVAEQALEIEETQEMAASRERAVRAATPFADPSWLARAPNLIRGLIFCLVCFLVQMVPFQ